MIHWNPDPIAIQVGPMAISWYGLTWSTSIIIGYFFANYVFKKENLHQEKVIPLIQYLFLGALIGARLFDTLYYNFDFFIKDPLMLFRVWEGGLASHGALMGMMLSLVFFIRNNKEFNYWWVIDMASIIGFAQGSLVRVGNFINGELYGKVTSLPWGVYFNFETVARHPVQLYEALYYFSCFIIMFAVYLFAIKRKNNGFYIAYFFILSFSGRILIEFFKEAEPIFSIFSQTQIVSVLGLLVGFVILYFKVFKKSA
jgi:prolipoprotein diacylglyceryl transferase